MPKKICPPWISACIHLGQEALSLTSIPEDHPEYHRFLVGTNRTKQSNSDTAQHKTDATQLYLVDYLDDTFNISSTPLPLPGIQHSFIIGGGLSVLTKLNSITNESVVYDTNDSYSNSKYDHDSDHCLLVGAGFRDFEGDIVSFLQVPIPKAVDPDISNISSCQTIPPLYQDSLSLGIQNPTNQLPAGRPAVTLSTITLQGKGDKRFNQLKKIFKLEDQLSALSLLNIVIIDKSGASVYNVENLSTQLSSVYGNQKFQYPTKDICYSGACNPHHAQQFGTVGCLSLHLWDIRTPQSESSCASTYWDLYCSQLDIDFNPNREFEIATAGEDGHLRFWDSRKLKSPIKILKKLHSHWMTGVRYNQYHDQLVITSGTDTHVNLWRLDQVEDQKSSCDMNLTLDDTSEKKYPVQQSLEFEQDSLLVHRFGIHEDTVHSISWSDAEPWVFASAGFDKKVAVYQVPNPERYRLLL